MKTKTNVKSGNFNYNFKNNNFAKNTIKLNRVFNSSTKIETLIKFDLKDLFNLAHKF